MIFRQHRLDDEFHHRLAQRLLADFRGVLGGKHHGVDGHRPAILIDHGDLALGVGAQPAEPAFAPHFGLLLHQAMGEGDGGGHQHLGLVGGVAEHHPLVAGALLAWILAVHALGDVDRLLADGVEHRAGVAVKAEVGVVVADVADHLAYQRLEVHPGRGGDLAGHQHEARLHQRFAGDPGLAVLAEDGVEDGVGDLVRHLVRVALGHRFRGKQASAGHGRIRCGGGRPAL